MKTQIDNNILEDILKTTEEIKVLRKKIEENVEDITQKLTKEIHELEQVPNPSEKLKKLIISAKFLLRDVQRIPKYCL
jgi:DNA repair ATPase RecN|tara:strand:+ start:230 stop:463 length:234 start_codon:yes stop_codon:yes gene_type:complete